MAMTVQGSAACFMRGLVTIGRIARWAVLLAALALPLTGCGPASQPGGDQPGSGQTAQQAGAPKQGGTMLLTTREYAPNLLLFTPAASLLGTTITVTPIYETLVSLDYKPDEDYRNAYRVIPWLAESWEMPDDHTYLFHIRKGVKWQDGEPFTAADVAWGYEYLRDPANKFRLAESLQSADQIEAVDRDTVRITTKGRAPDFLRDLTGGGSGSEPSIYPKHIFDQGKGFEKLAVGTGPFKLESWDPQSGATLVRNPDYWQPGKPYLDKIKLVYGVDAQASLAAFRAQQNDVVKLSDKPQFDALHALVPDAPYMAFPQQMADFLTMRQDRPPFNDPRVRKALHLAVDRQQMVNTISFGEGIVSGPGINGAREGWAIPQDELLKLPGYRQPKDQDIAEAKRLLAEAGYPDGLKTSIKFNSTHTRHPAEAQFLAEQLRSAGIQAELQPQENAVMVKTRADKNFDLVFDSSQFLPAEEWRNILHSNGNLNPGINDPDLDRIIGSFLTETDESKQKQLALQVQRLLLDKNYTIPTITQKGFLIWQPFVHGWVDNRAGQAVNKGWSQTWVDVDKLPPGR